jgi:hypothetical protein
VHVAGATNEQVYPPDGSWPRLRRLNQKKGYKETEGEEVKAA